ncbi:MAG: tRNA(Ile)-lysidine synthetase, partial [Actinomycetota bacterium]
MKCRVCRGPAVIDLRRHNANFCVDHFLRYCRQQVEKAIDDHHMLEAGERPLVAVSGGKDSLAVWDLLNDLGYDADGLYIGLGIGEYSETSGHYARDFADARGLTLIEIDLRADHGYDVPTAAAVTKRVPCSACGLSKRHLFDAAALDGGYDALVTGHNLDDEAAVLYGNVMRWQTGYLGRQRPVLAAANGFPRKVKPLIRLTERETAAYCVLRGIDYLVEECPMAVGNKHMAYKNALNEMELQSPGAKADFYHGFLARAVERFASEDKDADGLGTCTSCGSPAEGELCAFCRLADQASQADPVPVSVLLTPRKERKQARNRKRRSGSDNKPTDQTE